jgi:hypothetical protein
MAKCDVRLCKGIAIIYDKDLEMYLCDNCDSKRNIYENKGAFEAMKYSFKKGFKD